METRNLSIETPCPCCQSRMELAGLRCPQCSTKIEAPVQTHEFMSLSEEDLQLLRIFIQFEGRIRDMEAPLGLSYPTIRNRISDFKERIFKTPAVSKTEEPLDVSTEAKIFDFSSGNSSVLSKVATPSGAKFRFDENSINASHVSEFEMNESEFVDCSVNASKLDQFSLQSSSIQDCSFNGSHLSQIELTQAKFQDVEFHGSKISKWSLNQSQWQDCQFHGAHIKNWTSQLHSNFQDLRFDGVQADRIEIAQSNWQDLRFQGCSLKDLKFRKAEWTDSTFQGMSLENVRFIETQFRDVRVKLAGLKLGFFNSERFQNVEFHSCSFQDVNITNCSFENVWIRNVQLKDMEIRNLHLKDKKIESTEAFLALLK